jgi:hypothetical protein
VVRGLGRAVDGVLFAQVGSRQGENAGAVPLSTDPCPRTGWGGTRSASEKQGFGRCSQTTEREKSTNGATKFQETVRQSSKNATGEVSGGALDTWAGHTGEVSGGALDTWTAHQRRCFGHLDGTTAHTPSIIPLHPTVLLYEFDYKYQEKNPT